MTQDVTTCIPTQPPYSSKPLSPSPPSSPMSILSSSPSKSRCSRQSVRFADMPADISPRVPNTHKQRAPISPLKSATVQPVVATQPPSPYLDILETLLTRAPSCTARDNYVTPKRREHRAASSSSTTDSERSNGQRQAFSLQPPSTVSEKPIGESLFMIDCSDLPPLPRRRAGDPPTRQRFEFPSQEQLIDEINHKAMVVAQQRKAKRATTALLDTPKNGPQAYASTTGSHKEANNKGKCCRLRVYIILSYIQPLLFSPGVTGTSWIDVQGVPSEYCRPCFSCSFAEWVLKVKMLMMTTQPLPLHLLQRRNISLA